MSNNLNIKNPVSIYNAVADFTMDGGTYAYAKVYSAASGSVDIEYGKKVKWKMWLDKDDNYDNNIFLSFLSISTGQNDSLCARLDSSTIQFCTRTSPYISNTYSILDYTNQILDCEVTKSFQNIISFSINGIELSSDSSTWAGSSVGNWFIGGTSFGLDNRMDDGTIWDVEIYDTSTAGSPRIHYWKGYPAGNTSGAWEDLEGSYDGVVQVFSGTLGTRIIEGMEGGISINSMSNKLTLNPGAISKKLFLAGIYNT